eukprot:TRINITY_DN10596_c0_g1_i2.p1 TRINITY_DN10596_c0_g1~~TRINITY_DN10596_c0_g1_i2.p1  ORF type:complete len:152 (-),score=31.17 TRINITY_DN10596_c0_g1_i2:51-506(-)
MDASHPAELNEVENPIRHLNELTALTQNKYGNTPRPEKGELLFISAMQLAQRAKWNEAAQKLQAAIQEAKRASAGEPEAISAMCLGWVYTRIPGHKEDAFANYSSALQHWESQLGRDNAKLKGFLNDLAAVYSAYGASDQAAEFTARANAL